MTADASGRETVDRGGRELPDRGLPLYKVAGHVWPGGGPRAWRGRRGLPLWFLPEGPQRSPEAGPARRAGSAARRSRPAPPGAAPQTPPPPPPPPPPDP